MAVIYAVHCSGESMKPEIRETWEDKGELPEDYQDFCAFRAYDCNLLVTTAPDRKQVDVYRMLPDGSGVKKVGGLAVNIGYEKVCCFSVGGIPHIVCYESASGVFDFYRVDADFKLEHIYSYSKTYGQISTGFTTIDAYQYKGEMLLLGYNTNSGDVKIYQLEVPADEPLSLSCVWSKAWSPGWVRFTFFSMGSENFFLKSNIKHSTVYIDHLNDDPSSGSSPVGRNLPLPIDLDIVRAFQLNGCIHFLAYRKSGSTALNRLHSDCKGWTEELTFTAQVKAMCAVPLYEDDTTYLFLY